MKTIKSIIDNAVTLTQLHSAMHHADITPHYKGMITKKIQALVDADDTGTLEAIDKQEDENTPRINTDIENAIGEYFRSEVKHVSNEADTLSSVVVNLYQQSELGDDYCQDMVTLSTQYCVPADGKLESGLEIELWKSKQLLVVYPNYAVLVAQAEQAKPSKKGNSGGVDSMSQDYEKLNAQIKAVDKAFNRLIKAIAFLSHFSATEVSYNPNFKTISANLLQTIEGNEGYHGIQSFYIESMIKLAPKPAQSGSDPKLSEKKAGTLTTAELALLFKAKYEANGKAILPKGTKLPELEVLFDLKYFIEELLDDSAKALRTSLETIEDINNKIDREVNEGTNEELEKAELDTLEDADSEMLELETAQAIAGVIK